jgi:glucose-6-phosphate isomerase
MSQLIEFYDPPSAEPETGTIESLIEKAAAAMAGLQKTYPDNLGWLDPAEHASEGILDKIESTASKIREMADVFVLIGVGGSNNGARAALKALQNSGPEIVYAGTNLSPSYLRGLFEKVKNKSVCVNVIAKNFATMEPGIGFRFFRQWLEERYGDKARERIVVTGSREGDALYRFAAERGYCFLDFPKNMGGRYSVISVVGLLPMAVGGIDIRQVVQGAAELAGFLKNAPVKINPALRYAAARNHLYSLGYSNEILSSFEGELEHFSKWWIQLFAESEGKDGKGIFPSACVFSEDLHSLGQYIQQGRKMIMETFLRVKNSPGSLAVKPEAKDDDDFGYLDARDLSEVNRIAFEATFKAHLEGGTPCMIVEAPDISAASFGRLFYFFEYACAASGCLLGVNPFDQDGVEAYKRKIFAELKKQESFA